MVARYATFKGVVDRSAAMLAPCFLFEATTHCTARDLVLSLGISKTVVARLFARCQLFLKRDPARPLYPNTSVMPGDVVVLETQIARIPGPAEDGPLRVLYEDPFVLAVDKPAGLLVHGDGTPAPTLTSRVQGYLAHRGNPAVPQPVHRLDVDTTGAVLFATVEEFQPLFDGLVAGGGMRKRYLAAVRGTFPVQAATIDAPLARDRHDARRMRVAVQGGQCALTEVERLAVASDGSRSLLAVRLGTGRKHQIRVHLAAQGYPILNDVLYGSIDDAAGLGLHAFALDFDHPVTGEAVSVCAGWPIRFTRWFDPAAVRIAAFLKAYGATGEEIVHAARN